MNGQDDSKNAEQAWMFVHGELSKDARDRFEEQLARDAVLRALVDDIRARDRDLRMLAPWTTLSEEQLLADALEAWEKGRGTTAEEEDDALTFRRRSTVARVRSRRRPFHFSKPVRLALAVVACCAVAVVVMRESPAPPIVWETEIVQQAQYRGAGGEEALPRYTRAEMTDLTSSLRESVESLFRDLSATEKKIWPGWVLSTRIQELESGRLAVQVQAFKSKGQPPVKEWLKNYADAHAFRVRVNEYGEQIVKDLARLDRGARDYSE